MKKYLRLKKIIYIILISSSVNIFSGCTSIYGGSNNNLKLNLVGTKSSNSEGNIRILNYDEVKDALIRFHVIANSDSDEDQKLKIEIKNKVINYLYPYLNSSESLDQSRQIIKDKMADVKKLAEQIVKDNNYKYNIKVELSRENFPDKSYGNITLPQGNYEAFRIIIGSGQGKNWWCVMFPPLCFVDESKAQVEYDETENKIKAKQNAVNSEENGLKNQEDTNKENIKIKFKIAEVFREIFN
jgi:stage II sporulation protein R